MASSKGETAHDSDEKVDTRVSDKHETRDELELNELQDDESRSGSERPTLRYDPAPWCVFALHLRLRLTN